MISSSAHLNEIQDSPITLGNWQVELGTNGSTEALDGILEECGLWKVHKEVIGSIISPSPEQEDKRVKIDRILIPKADFVNQGWRYGTIGIECKKSGVKIGEPIAQAMDYARSIFELDNGFTAWLRWVFIWPMGPQHGPMASVLYQQRVGSAYAYSCAKLKLKLGEYSPLTVERDGNVRIGDIPTLRRAGSR